ncbi:hypothetical protein [Dethiothermospora halolimnae]|uniref:hypothetical protein n=1 Tax=Dethiothermospora halolimnae TaxID=3114390 RepID=UPI003CCBEEDF
MGEWKFQNLEKTDDTSVTGEQIYKEYGSTRYYKKNVLGEKIQCDRYGNTIHHSINDTTDNGNGYLGFGLLILVLIPIMLIGDIAKGAILILRYFPKIVIASIILTILIPFVEIVRGKSEKTTLLDLIYPIIKLINVVLGILVIMGIINLLGDKTDIIDLDNKLIVIGISIVGILIYNLIPKIIFRLILRTKSVK